MVGWLVGWLDGYRNTLLHPQFCIILPEAFESLLVSSTDNGSVGAIASLTLEKHSTRIFLRLQGTKKNGKIPVV